MIIFDASTLILLAKIELLEKFLSTINEKITIPREVETESCKQKDTLDALLILKAIEEKKIIVKVLKDRKLYDKIRRDFTLGRGEAEAIALAFEDKAQLVATDDKNAINACKLLKVRYTATLDILLRMSEKGILIKEEALLKLEALQRYGRYKKEIIAEAKLRLEGK